MASESNQLESSPTPEWGACSEGELQNLGKRLRGNAGRRRALVTGIAGAAAVAFVAVAVNSNWLSPGGISCAECVSRFGAYSEHLLAQQAAQPGQPAPEADATLVQVRQHLEGCRSCRESFERAYPSLSSLAAIGASAAFALVLLGVIRPKEDPSNTWPTGL